MISATFNFSEIFTSSIYECQMNVLFFRCDQSDFSLPIRFGPGVIMYIVMSKRRALDNQNFLRQFYLPYDNYHYLIYINSHFQLSVLSPNVAYSAKKLNCELSL
jgi:hypothetical protein